MTFIKELRTVAYNECYNIYVKQLLKKGAKLSFCNIKPPRIELHKKLNTQINKY